MHVNLGCPVLATKRKQPKQISADAAAKLVCSGDWLDFGFGNNQPDVFDKALAERIDELCDVKIRAGMALKPRAVLETDPEGKCFHWFSWHFSGYDRAKHVEDLCHYIPFHLGEVPDYYRRFLAPVDVAVLKVRVPDADGYCNLGPCHLWHRALVEQAKILILEISTSVPDVCGIDNAIHVSEADYIIAGDNAPMVEVLHDPVCEADRAVARQIAGEVEDGACLQIGIGSMPNAVCSMLKETGAKDLGIHTELMTDGLFELYKKGIVTGARKQTDPGKSAYTLGIGAQSLYDGLTANPDMLCCAPDYTNLPHNIMRNDKVLSINNTTQMDLQGQAASETSGFRHLSGTGGQAQFVRGAYASKGGKSFMCLSSVYERKGIRKSRIVLNFAPGDIVTTLRTDVMYVVTEYGMVNLKGKSVPERAHAMISLAHPDFREDLERQAYEHGLLPRHLHLAPV